jgi:hypothetical protein
MSSNEQNLHGRKSESILGVKEHSQPKSSKQSPYGNQSSKKNQSRVSESFGVPASIIAGYKSANLTPNFTSNKFASQTSDILYEHFDPSEGSGSVSQEKKSLRSLKHQALLKIINSENNLIMQNLAIKVRIETLLFL